MDRNIGSDDRDPEITSQTPRENTRSRPQEEPAKPESERSKSRGARPEREYQITDAQRQTLADIGRFRTISIEDLARFRYDGNAGRMGEDIRHFVSQKLVRTRTFWLGKSNEKLSVVVLTKEGKKLLENSGEPGTFYDGLVKPGEMRHDAAIYRMYQAEVKKITKSGGQIRCIALDYELKSKVYPSLAKEKPGSAEYKKRQAEIAAAHGLKVVRGHIQLPDLRIEYTARNGEILSKDLELATNHYRGGQLAAKAEAGFTFYASGEDARRLSAVFDDHNIMTEILSL